MCKYILLLLGMCMNKIKNKRVSVTKKLVKVKKNVKINTKKAVPVKKSKIIKNMSSQVKKPIKPTKKSISEERLIIEKEHKEKVIELAKKQISEDMLKEYVSKNVGSGANNILNLLVEKPDVDEKIAEILKLKLNETRRMLNLLNNYGLVKYNINKDSNGWLTFVWYMDYESVDQFSKKILEMSETKVNFLPQDCNDFFICNTCSKSHTMVVSFETAFDTQFKCVCGNKLSMIERDKAEELYKSISK